MKGFTLIELLVVITIIAFLSTMGLVLYSQFTKNARDARRQSDLKFIQSALEDYHSDLLFYPTAIGLNDVLSSGATFTSDTGIGSGVAPSTGKKYLNEVPKDPIVSTATPYCYTATPSSCDNSSTNSCKSYNIYAKLENPPSGAGSYSCGSATYNFQMTPP